MNDISNRFWSKVNIKSKDECWNWTAGLFSHRYGTFRVGNRMELSHRVAWKLTYGEIPKSKYVLHRCDNGLCNNPDHLYLGTQSDNIRDRAIRNPNGQGGGQPNFYAGEIWLIRKLKIVKSKNIYTRYKFSESFIAKMFKVDQSLIHLIWNSYKWLCKEGSYV